MTETPLPDNGVDDLDDAAPRITSRRDLVTLSLAALGVVYGDIGTSPLYTIRECFLPGHGAEPTPANVLGVLSLVFWSLALVVVLKYLVFVMRADNRGEGGIMALIALISPAPDGDGRGRRRRWLILLGLFGTALLFADGMITPVITVLGAVEGLEAATPVLRPFVVPISLGILVALFLVQKRGTARVGAMFGPAMVLWFVMIAALGLPWVLRHPEVLAAVAPWHGIGFLLSHRLHGLFVLGAVVLCFTGTEALYADMGHFGPRPIRFAWSALVCPCLLLNYFGQGAVILGGGARAVANPFFALAPEGLLYPVVAIATAAAVIASQALISGAFSLAQQAMQLGYSPRLDVVYTSSLARGQIYVPEINGLLLIACCALTVVFRSSSSLAAAYGLAVTGTMTITSLLLHAVARERWGWSRARAGALVGLFLCIDLPFFAANLVKITHGGWLPLVVGGAVFAVLVTWKQGRELLAEQMKQGMVALDRFLPSLRLERPHRVAGTAVFMTSNLDVVPPVLLHHFKHNKVLHEKVILLYVLTERVPVVPLEERVEVRGLGDEVYSVIARFGFMETPDVPRALKQCRTQGLRVKLGDTSYYLGRETLLTTGTSGMPQWRKSLFAYLSRNARPATAFFGLPPNRVVELGMQVRL
ncbi:MAG: potassium transporter Kup [Holophagae bacterium]|nr:MAG: potassium transporter Kup [Holophagae bacterium]